MTADKAIFLIGGIVLVVLSAFLFFSNIGAYKGVALDILAGIIWLTFLLGILFVSWGLNNDK